MGGDSIPRRSVLQALAAAGGAGLLSDPAQTAATEPSLDPHTKATYRAVIDAVVPRTPELGAKLGPEHVPGGLATNCDAYMITSLNTLFSFGIPRLGRLGTLRLATLLAAVLDLGATKLILIGGNEDPPSLSRAIGLLGEPPSNPEETVAKGPFAQLSRMDRLRALAVFDQIEFDTSVLPGPLIRGDGGLIAQLMVAFTELVYYSEWQGYADFTAPPGKRGFTNDPSAVQSWRQTGFPGIADGYAALRGYWGTPESSLGSGDPWKRIEISDTPVEITDESGHFRENDYDTSGYEEIYPEQSQEGAV